MQNPAGGLVEETGSDDREVFWQFLIGLVTRRRQKLESELEEFPVLSEFSCVFPSVTIGQAAGNRFCCDVDPVAKCPTTCVVLLCCGAVTALCCDRHFQHALL